MGRTLDAVSKDHNGPTVGQQPSVPCIAEGVQAFVKRMIEIGESAKPLRRALGPASVRVESDGGEVAVIVTLGGALIGVDFSDAHEAVEDMELVQLILATYHRALAEAERRRAELSDATPELPGIASTEG